MQEFNQLFIFYQPAKSDVTLDLIDYLLISSPVRSIVNMKLHLITYVNCTTVAITSILEF